MPSLLDPEAYGFANPDEDRRKKLSAQNAMAALGGLLSQPVEYVKGRATSLLTDPIGDIQRTLQGTVERAKARDLLTQKAYGDPKNPLRVTDQAAADQLANEYLDMASTVMPMGMTVYHGSPYKFSAFDPIKIGSGEGAQAYGYGHYVAESPDVAKQYRDMLRQKEFSKIVEKGRNSYDVVAPDGAVIASDVLYGNAHKAKNAFDESVGSVYKIDLPDEQIANMLDWDKPISKQPTVMKALRSEAEQRVRDRLQIDVENEIIKGMPPPDLSGGYMDLFSEANIPLNKKVQEQALEKINQMDLKPLVEKELDSMKPPDMTWDMSGQDFYRLLSTRSGAPEKASDVLRNQGVPGIRYLDQASRSPETGNATSNFVVFPKNEGLLKIEEINGQPVQGGLLKAPQAEALKTAQKNAALPIEKGGLGLPKDNTPMDRAKAMGFDVDTFRYHGSDADIYAFDPKKFGKNDQGWYGRGVTTDTDPEIAAGYANYREPESGQVIYPLLTKGKYMDWPEGQQPFSSMRDSVEGTRDIQNLGYSGTRFTNDRDLYGSTPDIGTEQVTFNPSDVRSIFAAFDPMRKNEANILAGALPFGLLSADEETKQRLRNLIGF